MNEVPSPGAPPPLPSADWYYADDARQRHGPVGEQTLIELYRQGALRRETLVWREGMEGWRSLENMITLPMPDAAAVQFRSGVPSGVVPQKKGMSGCLIVAIVLGVLAVPMIAIMAAIALPAYQNYTIKSKVYAARAATLAIHHDVQQAIDENDGECPTTNALPGFSNANVSLFEAGKQASGYCGYSITLKNIAPTVDGQRLTWSYVNEGDSPHWECSSALPDKYLPSECKSDSLSYD